MDFSEYPEHLQPLDLETTPESVDDCVYACYEEHGADTPQGAIINTVISLGFGEETRRSYFGFLCTAARYARQLKDAKLERLTKGQAMVLFVNTALRINHDERLYAVADNALRDGMSVREVYEATGVPHSRRLLTNRKAVKHEEFITTIRNAPERIGQREIKKYLLFINRRCVGWNPRS